MSHDNGHEKDTNLKRSNNKRDKILSPDDFHSLTHSSFLLGWYYYCELLVTTDV